MGYIMIQQTGDVCQGDDYTNDNQTHLFPHVADNDPADISNKTNPHIEWKDVV